MEEIRTFAENLFGIAGVSGTTANIAVYVLMVVIVSVLSWLAGYICRRVLMPMVLRLTAHTDVTWDDKVFNKTVLTSACRIVPAIVIWKLLPLVFSESLFLNEFLKRATAIYITVMSVRTMIVLVDSVKEIESEKYVSMQQYLRSFCGVFKIVLVFVAVIIVAAILIDKSPLRLFAGLGATSAILMLVFKDTIEGLVAGIRLTSNDMLHKGDWITVPSTNANGTVEEMTLTTVKIRNFDNTIVTVSPQTLVNGSFQNWVGMQQSAGRRVTRTLYYDIHTIKVADDTIKENLLRHGYFTEEELNGEHVNMTLLCRYMEKFLSMQPEVNTSMQFMVHQLNPTTTGLPVEFYFFLTEKDWIPYEHQLADIMNRIYAMTPDFGLKIYQRYPQV
ncbi:MAG: mechanosensitive ion channel [Prevotella sp.]|nr:mechanosensitive ion channel [Prevotella sp.]